MAEHLTHVDETGAARMVDVSGKQPSVRRAVAAGLVRTTPEVVALLRAEALPKGDALTVARIAGILGAKRTPDLIPLCHPIGLHAVTVGLTLVDGGVEITATTRTAQLPRTPCPLRIPRSLCVIPHKTAHAAPMVEPVRPLLPFPAVPRRRIRLPPA